ncbi:hypothetical protein AJ80_05154 [Polytolypa hystricis UAMH7299]|uniref:RRM domain-containing protein n=1 Tax=Polytolypa hystricis (strain UAMH7299) TaxID=1447883 RepID=A0A2B7Y6Z2_POLH7|nr:hypothetical protein AJ80_05154 [Polytolypa hystricis UAMH7299]
MATYVTIEKAYLETLLRRAEFHVSAPGLDASTNVETVTIPKSDHELLLRRSREYDNLKKALYQGGVSEDALETLINGPDDPAIHSSPNGVSSNNHAPANTSRPPPPGLSSATNGHSSSDRPASYRHGQLNAPERSQGPPVDIASRQYSFDNDDSSFLGEEKYDGNQPPTNAQSRPERQHTNCTENRTLVFRGIPDRTTHRDIVSVIRGGALIDVFLRSRERMASISFAEGKAAQEFLAYAKRNNIYVLDKLIDVSWAERQFFLPGHVSTKMANGASRNIVIRHVHPNIDEARIRDDLEHIHNLIVIGVTFDRGDAYISTNSVHNALFARTCMMSRLAYKGMKIEYYPDECAEPLPRAQPPRKKKISPPAKRLDSTINRFQMLNMDGTDDGSDDDELANGTALVDTIRWADTSITA